MCKLLDYAGSASGGEIVHSGRSDQHGGHPAWMRCLSLAFNGVYTSKFAQFSSLVEPYLRAICLSGPCHASSHLKCLSLAPKIHLYEAIKIPASSALAISSQRLSPSQNERQISPVTDSLTVAYRRVRAGIQPDHLFRPKHCAPHAQDSGRAHSRTSSRQPA